MKKVLFRNLTPHKVNVLNDDNEVMTVFPPDELLPPVRVNTEPLDMGKVIVDTPKRGLLEIPITALHSSDVQNLPEPVEGILLIVSTVVQSFASDRIDLVVPYPLVRDDQGVVIGCRGFSRGSSRDETPTEKFMSDAIAKVKAGFEELRPFVEQM